MISITKYMYFLKFNSMWNVRLDHRHLPQYPWMDIYLNVYVDVDVYG